MVQSTDDLIILRSQCGEFRIFKKVYSPYFVGESTLCLQRVRIPTINNKSSKFINVNELIREFIYTINKIISHNSSSLINVKSG